MRRLTLLIQEPEPVSDLLPVLAAVIIGLLSWYLFGGKGNLLIANLLTFVLVLQRLNLSLRRASRAGLAVTAARRSSPLNDVVAGARS